MCIRDRCGYDGVWFVFIFISSFCFHGLKMVSIKCLWQYFSVQGNDYFTVDGEGNVTVNRDLSSKFSQMEIINFKIVARDLGGLSATATISIIFPEVCTPYPSTSEQNINSPTKTTKKKFYSSIWMILYLFLNKTENISCPWYFLVSIIVAIVCCFVTDDNDVDDHDRTAARVLGRPSQCRLAGVRIRGFGSFDSVYRCHFHKTLSRMF